MLNIPQLERKQRSHYRKDWQYHFPVPTFIWRRQLNRDAKELISTIEDRTPSTLRIGACNHLVSRGVPVTDAAVNTVLLMTLDGCLSMLQKIPRWGLWSPARFTQFMISWIESPSKMTER